MVYHPDDRTLVYCVSMCSTDTGLDQHKFYWFEFSKNNQKSVLSKSLKNVISEKNCCKH